MLVLKQKELFARLQERLERQNEHEKEEKMRKTTRSMSVKVGSMKSKSDPSPAEHYNKKMMAADESSDSSSSDSDTSSSPHKNDRHDQPRRKHHTSPRSSLTTSSLALHDLRSSSSTVATLQSSQPSLSSSIRSSPLQLPMDCLRESDGCDEAELRAREKRCQEIMRLSQQAKEAEIARAKAANIQPLTWAKPTFELPSTAAVNVAATAAARLGKRKEREESASSSTTSQRCHFSHLDLVHSGMCWPTHTPSQEEIDMFLEFVNKYLPSSKRRRIDVDTESEASEKEEGKKSDES